MKKVLLLTALLAAGVAQASLVLKINTTDKTFTFTGSDAGTPASGWITWNNQESVGAGDLWTGEIDDISATCTSTLEYSGATAPHLDLDQSSGFRDSIFTAATITFVYTENSCTELDGTGVYQSYAALNSLSQAHFESLIGGTFAASTAGFSDIQVEAVPEPATAGLLSISVGALWLIRRLKKAANYYLT